MSTFSQNLGSPAGRQPAQARRGVVAGLQGRWLGANRRTEPKVKRRDLAFILRNLATLVGNGLSLPKSLGTLARERSLRKHTHMLDDLRREVERGQGFSGALAKYPHTFNEVVVNQIRAGEKAGNLGTVLKQVARQVENTNRTRSRVIRRLSYPAILVGAASAAITFMLVFVIPVFEQTYAEARIPLPLVTRALMAAGEYTVAYGWLVPLTVVAGSVAVKHARKRQQFSVRMDRAILQLPLLGDWLRNLAVLQFINVFENLIESGFKVVDALDMSAGSIGNRAVRASVRDLQAAVTRGERFGRELALMGDLFPPVVSQLIAVGERTGRLCESTSHIRDHLEQEVERQTNLLVGMIEPILTIGLAATIAAILLAVYLPMFDLIGTVRNG